MDNQTIDALLVIVGMALSAVTTVWLVQVYVLPALPWDLRGAGSGDGMRKPRRKGKR